MAIRMNTTASALESTSLKFGWVKKMFYLYSLVSPDDPSTGIPHIWLDLPCVVRRRLGGEKLRRRCFFVFVFSFFICRVIVVARSHPVLATGPCWHSCSLRHVTASLHNSEARVLFHVCGWLTAVEARPKRSPLIGYRSINSDCHVLLVESL